MGVSLQGAEDFVEKGFCVVNEVMPQSEGLKLGHRLDSLVQSSTGINHPRADSAAVPFLRDATEWEVVHDALAEEKYRISDDDFQQGPSAYRDRVYHVTVRDTFIDFPEFIDVAFNEDILEFVSNYFGAPATLEYVKIKKSFANKLPSTHTNLFHVDDNAEKIVKILMYLNDVEEGGGPFTYVSGSHAEKFDGWDDRVLWDREAMEERYGSDKVVEFKLPAGSAALADTTGFHCEKRQEAYDRGIVSFNYVQEDGYQLEGFGSLKLPEQAYEAFTPVQRAAASMCKLVTP